MKRYLVAFASVLIGIVLTLPYAILKMRDLPLIVPKVANGPPRQMTPQEMLFITECCVVFYAVTYFAGKRIYAAIGRREDGEIVQQLSGTHMRLLHSFVGAFMIASPWFDQAVVNRNPLATSLSVAVGLAMLASGIWGIYGWLRAKLAGSSKQE